MTLLIPQCHICFRDNPSTDSGKILAAESKIAQLNVAWIILARLQSGPDLGSMYSLCKFVIIGSV